MLIRRVKFVRMKKFHLKFIFLFILSLFTINQLQSQVGIGTDAPHSSAKLDVSSTTQGVLTPRMTSSQRSSISSPATGLLVFQTDGSSGFYYYTGSSWINLTSGGTGGVPSGTIMAYAGSAAPTGWAFCDGSAISRTTYADLYAAIGTTYGSGNGSTTFNLPDLRGRSIYGTDNMGGSAAGRLTTTGGISANNTLGATGGNQTTTLLTANLPVHNHTFTGSSVTSSSNTHSHTYNDAFFAENFSGGVGSNARFGSGTTTDNDNNFYWRTSSNTHSQSISDISSGSDTHSHTVTAAGTIGNTGSGTAIAPLLPAIVLNYMIKL